MDGERSTLLSRRPAAIALWLLLGALLLFLGGLVRPSVGQITNGYASYYTAATLVREGADVVDFYDNEWFMEQTIRVGFVDAPDVFWVNPPPVALLFYPLTPFSPERADVLWTLANAVLLAIAAAVILPTLRDAGLVCSGDRVALFLLIAITLIFNPIWRNIEQGQVYILLLVGTALAFRGYVLGQRRTGIWLGLLLGVKTAGALLWLGLLFDRRWRSLAAGMATVAAVVVLSSLVVGISAWVEYARRIPSLFDEPWTGVTAYQTTSSLIHHSLKAAEPAGMQPLVDLPWLAQPLSTVTNLLLLASAVAIGWLRHPRPAGRLADAVRFSLLLSLTVPLQPLGEEHHYVLLLPAVWVGLALAARPASGAAPAAVSFALATGVVLIALPYPITDPWFEPGVRALLAYPKLYGGLLLGLGFAGWLLAESRRLDRADSGYAGWRWDILLPWTKSQRPAGRELMRGGRSWRVR